MPTGACTGRDKMVFANFSYHGHLLETSTPGNIWIDAHGTSDSVAGIAP